MKKVIFMPTPFPLLKGVFSGAEGEGVLSLVRIPSRWSWAKLATSSLEGLDISVCISHETGLWIGSALR